MRKKRKTQVPRSSLRDSIKKRTGSREDMLWGTPEQEGRFRLAALPALLLKNTNEYFFQKSVAAIMIVILLGLFSLFDLPLTNRLTSAIHNLTVHQMSPSELVEQIQPVMQSVRNFSWPNRESPSPQVNPGAGEDEISAPVNGILISSYGTRPGKSGEGTEMHYGIDVSTEPHAPVYAVLPGVVSLVQEHPVYGLTVYVRHGEDLVSIYGRCTQPFVSTGQKVKSGQQLAVVATGENGSHLHFEIWKDGRPVDPQEVMGELR